METENNFVPLFPGQTQAQAEHAVDAEQQYLQDTRWQDGPTEIAEWPPVKIKGY
jgi:hypothetical protein